jgi:uncharacterized protein (DUF2235 family)
MQDQIMNLKLFPIFILTILSGCTGVTYIHNPITDSKILANLGHPEYQVSQNAPKNIAVFFDGTGNNPNSATNIGHLYQFASNQSRTNNVLFYTSGVGTDYTSIIGLTTGLGFRKDIESAYGFLADYYASKADVIHLYGYSRGAFAARALAGLVHTVGLVDLSTFKNRGIRKKFLSDLFTVYKFPARYPRSKDCIIRNYVQKLFDIRRCAMEEFLRVNGVRVLPHGDRKSVKFAVVGLWDTVEALGGPDYYENPDETNTRYSDQICNMEMVLHAVSLHDNRAKTYTPILMTRNRLVRDCDGDRPAQLLKNFERVEEVWFAGDHSQLGGSESRGHLSGVSLNWMLEKTKHIGVGNASLFPKDARVHEQPLDFVKDAQRQSWFFRTFFLRRPRNIRCYAKLGTNKPDTEKYLTDGSAQHEIKIHESVRFRMKNLTIPASERPNAEGSLTQELPLREQWAQVASIAKDIEDYSFSESCPAVPIKYVR